MPRSRGLIHHLPLRGAARRRRARLRRRHGRGRAGARALAQVVVEDGGGTEERVACAAAEIVTLLAHDYCNVSNCAFRRRQIDIKASRLYV